MLRKIYLASLLLAVLLSACNSGNYNYNQLGPGNPAASGNFTWIAGSDSAEQPGVYGIKGTADPLNTPGARQYTVSWTDSNGNLWLFGGFGLDAGGATTGYLNDLWKYDVSNATWTWVGGSKSINQPGTYGTRGTPASANIPGARSRATGWTDASGNLWLFGGSGYDSNGTSVTQLNDLWQYNIANATWTWVAGNNTGADSGCYAIASCTPLQPGSRERASGWIDSSGNALWLFGGNGIDGNGTTGLLNDFWKFDITTSTWSWAGGSATVNQNGSYSAPAMPGSRAGASGWLDAYGYLWLFGGHGLDRYGVEGSLNDLWQYTAATAWTWSGKGDQTANTIGNYSLPVLAPGSRDGAAEWTDSNGNLWLFGGNGYDSAGNKGHLNDVWMFDRVGTSGWNWVNGANTVDQSGVYGTQGTAAATNIPGAREGAASWVGSDGSVWLFGGNGMDGNGAPGNLNDLWHYTP